MQFHLQEFLTQTFTLFAVIDIVGSVPMLISIKQKTGGINAWKVTLISGALMVLFFFIGKPFLNVLGVDIRSFAVAGSIVIFILGLEMVRLAILADANGGDDRNESATVEVVDQ